MFAWLTINTMICVPYRTDSETVTESYQMKTKPLSTFKTQLNPLDSFQNIHIIFFICINFIYLLNIIHLIYFITRHLIIYLTACSIILTSILITHFTFINFNDAMSYLLIVKRFELYMDLALYKKKKILYYYCYDSANQGLAKSGNDTYVITVCIPRTNMWKHAYVFSIFNFVHSR